MQALNAFEGAVILISHDRHMVELTADRLVLVDGGTATEYPGSIEDYIDFVLGRNQPRHERGPKSKKDSRASAKVREAERLARNSVAASEKLIDRLQGQISTIDDAMANPSAAAQGLAAKSTGELVRQRAAVAAELEDAERQWLEANESLERVGA